MPPRAQRQTTLLDHMGAASTTSPSTSTSAARGRSTTSTSTEAAAAAPTTDAAAIAEKPITSRKGSSSTSSSRRGSTPPPPVAKLSVSMTKAYSNAEEERNGTLEMLRAALHRLDDAAADSLTRGRGTNATGSGTRRRSISGGNRRRGAKSSIMPVMYEPHIDGVDIGTGTPKDPIHCAVFTNGDTNDSGCMHCTHTNHCDCEFIADTLHDVFENQLSRKRIIERGAASGGGAGAGATGTSGRHLCAKSLLPPFVARLLRLQQVGPGDTYVDLGCGNGSVLFQVAYSTGAACLGIELCPHNAQLARDAWALLKPIFEQRSGRTMPHLEIITGDIAHLISEEAFIARPRKILLSNLLFPKILTYFIAERCRALPVSSSIVCFDDLYPHGRSVCKVRDPEVFQLFDMKDYVWPQYSVEWCYQEGPFYIHTRKPKEEEEVNK